MGEILDLPVIHLDKLHWKPGWAETPKPEWKRTVEELVRGDMWIIDGNFGGTMEIRLDACDTVVYLDYPRTICLGRALKRWAVYRNKTRPDMGDGCTERFDLKFLGWVWNFPQVTRPTIERRLSKLPRDKQIIRLSSPAETKRFLLRLRD
jgi:adenylate kinase family enzyme